MPLVRFIPRPDALPDPPLTGRVVLVDLAFAAGADFTRITAPFLAALGDRLALWIDHHDHPAWREHEADPRFLLVSKLTARACPELVNEAVVARAGVVDEIWAHADFDGCVAAAKFLRRGRAPYAEADEDARAADAPGRGFQCSERGQRYCAAIDELQSQGGDYVALLDELCSVLAGEVKEDAAFTKQIDRLAKGLDERRRRLAPLLAAATRPHKDLVVLKVGKLSGPEKKLLLRELEETARVALLHGSAWSTIATYDDESIDLSSLPGLRGQRGYAFGQVAPDEFMPALLAMLGA